jgi:hypothetical protein
VQGSIINEVEDAALARLATDEDICRNIKVFKEIELLMNKCDARMSCILDGQSCRRNTVNDD